MAKFFSHRTARKTDLSFGMLLVVLGCATFVLSQGRDGFDKGLFQGATIALMVFGAYLLGSATWSKSSEDDENTKLWLPSDDKLSDDKLNGDQE